MKTRSIILIFLLGGVAILKAQFVQSSCDKSILYGNELQASYCTLENEIHHNVWQIVSRHTINPGEILEIDHDSFRLPLRFTIISESPSDCEKSLNSAPIVSIAKRCQDRRSLDISLTSQRNQIIATVKADDCVELYSTINLTHISGLEISSFAYRFCNILESIRN